MSTACAVLSRHTLANCMVRDRCITMLWLGPALCCGGLVGLPLLCFPSMVPSWRLQAPCMRTSSSSTAAGAASSACAPLGLPPPKRAVSNIQRARRHHAEQADEVASCMAAACTGCAVAMEHVAAPSPFGRACEGLAPVLLASCTMLLSLLELKLLHRSCGLGLPEGLRPAPPSCCSVIGKSQLCASEGRDGLFAQSRGLV